MYKNYVRYAAFACALACSASLVSADRMHTKGSGKKKGTVGANTKGAESSPDGYKEVHVTTLDDDREKPSEGSLRWALEKEKGPRKIVFDVEGVIEACGNFSVKRAEYVTIDGATAPGKGITIAYASLNISDSHDIVVRHLRIRPSDEVIKEKGQWENKQWGNGKKGDGEVSYGPADGLSLKSVSNSCVEYCSISWSLDEAMSGKDLENVTFQWCLVAEPLGAKDLHKDGTEHAYGSLITGKNVLVHHCGYFFCRKRNPRIGSHSSGDVSNIAVVNNAIYGYGEYGAQLIGDTKDKKTKFHVHNNKYVSNDNDFFKKQRRPSYIDIRETLGKKTKFYVEGNVAPMLSKDECDPLAGITMKNGKKDAESIKKRFKNKSLFNYPESFVVESADDAYDNVLAHAGAQPRDCIDKRIVDQVCNDEGGVISGQDDVGGFDCL